jgi:hypothetical protein
MRLADPRSPPAAHFIKTVEDLYEVCVQASPALKFGIAFNEASPGYEAMPGACVHAVLPAEPHGCVRLPLRWLRRPPCEHNCACKRCPQLVHTTMGAGGHTQLTH